MIKKILIIFLVSLFLVGCGIKKFPQIPFFKSAPEIKQVDYQIKNGKVILTWNKLHDESIKFYNLYRANAPEGVEYCFTCDPNYRKITSIDPEEFGEDKISITIEDLRDDYRYCYAVKVETKSGKESDFSNKVCFDWYYNDNLITNVKILPEDRSLKISWHKNLDNNIKFLGVNIYRKDRENNLKLVGSEPEKDFFVVKHLTNGKKYTFYIAPTYKYDNTTIEGKGIKVAGIPEDLTPPALPNFFTGYFTNGGIFLKWAKSTSDDIFGYDIIRKAEGEKRYTQINRNIIKKESFFDANVKKGKIYYYKIRCIDTNFNASNFSNAIKIIAE